MMLPDYLKKLVPSTIRSQLILGVTFIHVLLMSLLVIQQVDRQKSFLLKQNYDRAVGLSVNLANTANSYVISYELAGLQKLVASYKNIPDMKYSLVTSEDGTVLAHTDEKYIGLKATDSISARLKPVNATQTLVENNFILDVATPITRHGEIIGWARTGLSQEYIKSNLRDIERRGIIYILISLILGSLFAILVSGRLTKGLQTLVTAAQKIKGGDRDLRVGPSGSIEISQLGTAFNQMLDDISSNEKLLRNVLENLPVGVWILDEKGKVISCNPAGQELWNGVQYVGVDEYNAYKAWFTETGREVQNHEWGAALVLAEGKPVFNQELEIECFDKSRKIILNSAIPLRVTGEKITGVITINVDITVRKKAEEKLKQSEEKNRALVENITDAIVLLDANSQVIYQSPSAERITGYPFQDRTRDQPYEFVYKDDQAQVTEIVQRAMREPGVPINYQVRLNHKEGRIIWIEATILNLLHNESVKALVVTYRDVTDRKKVTDMLKHQMDNSPDMILVINKDFTIESINRGRPNGPAPQELIGKNSLEILPEETRTISKETIQWCFETGMNQEVENILYGNVWVRSRFAPIKVDNVITHIMIIATDITERKKAEEQLKRSEERHRALIENISDTIILVDENAKVLYQSPAFMRTAGFSLSELNGKTAFDLVHPDDLQSAKVFFAEVLKSPGIPLEAQYRIMRKHGSYFWAEGTMINLLHNESVKAFVLNYRDITERINAEKEKLEIQQETLAMLEDKVAERTEELYKTNQLLALRNQKISDSISYARHIQQAVLSKPEECSKIFPDSFVLWMPKDVVSGDFLWCYSNYQYDFIAVVDCTGHGVPAAMMSIIANEMLDRVVNTLGLHEPREILSRLDNEIISYLKQESGIVKDGMDIVICRVDKTNNLLTFAGAQRPLFYYNGQTFSEIGGSKFGVGGFLSDHISKVFDQKEINYQEGDTFYLMSDGYYSQFGGEHGKKLMKKRMAEYISGIVDFPISKQKKLLHEYYKRWQGYEDQVDDVLTIGIRF